MFFVRQKPVGACQISVPTVIPKVLQIFFITTKDCSYAKTFYRINIGLALNSKNSENFRLD